MSEKIKKKINDIELLHNCIEYINQICLIVISQPNNVAIEKFNLFTIKQKIKIDKKISEKKKFIDFIKIIVSILHNYEIVCVVVNIEKTKF